MNGISKPLLTFAFAILLIYSCIKFYEEPLPPSVRSFHALYHSLHGNDPHPSNYRRFPNNLNFSYSYSVKLDEGNNKELSVYAKLSQIAFTSTETGIIVVFDAGRFQNLPSLNQLAPEPTLHVGDSIFPIRQIAQIGKTSTESKYAFVFPPLGYIEDDSLDIYLDESKSATFRIENPTPPPRFWDQTGTNLWPFLILFIALPGLVFTLIPWKGNYLDDLANEWGKIDSRRAEAERTIGGLDEADSRKHRYRAAQLSLDRAERMIMEFYDERLRGPSRLFWYLAALISILGLGTIFAYSISSFTSSLPSPSSWQDVPRDGLAARVRSLEAFRPATSIYMMIIVLLGLIGIAANILLSVWRIKATARKIIKKRIDGFEEIFEEKLLSQVETADRTVEELRKKLLQMSESAEHIHGDLKKTVEAGITESELLVEQELAEIKRVAVALNTKAEK